MKKRLTILICLSVVLSAIAQPPQKTVVATASIFADMAENIAGGHVTIKSIVPIGGDPHIYEPTPADARLVASADLILKNALTFEGWLDQLIASANTKAKVVTITEGVEAIHAAHKNSSDPHAWMSAANGLIYIENIKNALVELDPANREVYEFNHGVYRKQLEELDAYIFNEVKKIPESRRILITSHDAFEYFGKRYGLRLESVLGISTDAEAQTSDMQRLAKVIQESGVPAVFIETTVNPKLLEQIAADNKVRIGGKLFSDSIGEAGSDAPSYYQMLKYNCDTVVKALAAADGGAEENGAGEGSTSWVMWALLVLLLVGGFLFVAKKMNG
ncbi:MAG: zinc ABC transporter substrate-binding protein [Saprospiraceae bacterium]|nr:zinc ABC transporter substrate-binding protein [Saprospiraceae bacterium]